MFPEGQLSEDGELQPILPGAALLARMSGATVICCGLRNTNRVMPYGRTVPRMSFRRVLVEFGEPKTFGKHAEAQEILGWVDGQFRELTDASEGARGG